MRKDSSSLKKKRVKIAEAPTKGRAPKKPPSTESDDRGAWPPPRWPPSPWPPIARSHALQTVIQRIARPSLEQLAIELGVSLEELQQYGEKYADRILQITERAKSAAGEQHPELNRPLLDAAWYIALYAEQCPPQKSLSLEDKKLAEQVWAIGNRFISLAIDLAVGRGAEQLTTAGGRPLYSIRERLMKFVSDYEDSAPVKQGISQSQNERVIILKSALQELFREARKHIARHKYRKFRHLLIKDVVEDLASALSELLGNIKATLKNGVNSILAKEVVPMLEGRKTPNEAANRITADVLCVPINTARQEAKRRIPKRQRLSLTPAEALENALHGFRLSLLARGQSYGARRLRKSPP